MDLEPLNIQRIRAETPGCEHVLHFNNAGASLMPVPVIEAMNGVLQDEIRFGGYEAERRAGDQLVAFYAEFGALLNAEPGEIAYVENATRAWDMAFYGLQLEPGDRILTHGSEYVSNYLALLHQAKRRQLEIDVVPSDASGQIDCDALERMITPRTKLIAITHVPTQGGLVNPAEEVGRIARRHGLIYMLDACQSVGQIDINVREIGCHVLSGTGRKFLRGPRGTGFLYVANDIVDRIDPPFIDLRAATWTEPDRYVLAPGAKRFENWESNVAGRVGLAAAVRYARSVGMDRIAGRVALLAERLRGALAEVKGVTLHDLGSRKCGIVTFRKGDVDPLQMHVLLREAGINVSVSPLAYARLDLGARGLPSLLRASVHYFNTEAEIETFAMAVARL
jgi:cysteine desulfurase / selenocysteine lyase